MSWNVITRYVDLLRFEADIVNILGFVAEVPKDPHGAPILATSIASKADCLMSGDDALLRLAGRYPILSPGEFTPEYFKS